MNFEKQVCKQTQDQPGYLKAEELITMQRASMARYDRTSNQMVLLPPFFAFTDKLIEKTDKGFAQIAPVQRCSFYFTSDVDVSNFVCGQIRNVRPLPLVLKQNPTVSSCNRLTTIPTKTSYDLVYYYFPDPASSTPVSATSISEKLIQDLELGSGFEIVPQFQGASIIARNFADKETILQNPCIYETIPPPAEIPPLEELSTPGAHTIEDLAKFTGKPATELVKAVMYSLNGKLVFVNIRGDLDVSEDKLRAFLGLTDSPDLLELAPEELLTRHGLVPGFTGLVGIKRASEAILIIDNSVKTVPVGVTGACKQDYHFINFNLEQDTKKISKFLKWADVAVSERKENGSVIADVIDCSESLAAPSLLGLDNKPHNFQMFKITLRLVDATAALINTRKIPGAYVINMMKDTEKLDKTVTELKKIYGLTEIVVDDRPKANFGVKNDSAKMSLFENLVVVSNKLDADTVSVNENPIPIASLSQALSSQ